MTIVYDPKHPPVELDCDDTWCVARSVAANLRTLSSNFNQINTNPKIRQVFVPFAHYFQFDVLIKEVLFPGYFMVQGDMDAESCAVIRGFFPACKILTANGKPDAPYFLTSEEVRHVEELCNGTSYVIQGETYKPGEFVLILSGPFSSFKGKVVSHDIRTNTVTVSFVMFGRECNIKIDGSQVSSI